MESQKIIPPTARRFQGWDVGLLERFDVGDEVIGEQEGVESVEGGKALGLGGDEERRGREGGEERRGRAGGDEGRGGEEGDDERRGREGGDEDGRGREERRWSMSQASLD